MSKVGCESCIYSDLHWDDEPCDECYNHSKYKEEDNMKSCRSCMHRSLNIYDYPCDVCNYEYSEYKSKEDDIVRDCDNCLHEDVSIFDEPCSSCIGEDAWESKGEVGKFKVGDIITGIDGHRYLITNKNAICEVVEIVNSAYSDVVVKLLSTTDDYASKYIGDTYHVQSEYFKLTDGFKVGDIIIGSKDKGNNYTVTDHTSVCEVIDVYGEYITVKVIGKVNNGVFTEVSSWATEFDVKSKHFDIYEIGKIEDSECKFKVGDIIVGSDKDRYNITNSDSVCEVIKILDEGDDEGKWDKEVDILVKVLSTTDPYRMLCIGDLFYVDSKYFDLHDRKVEDLGLVNLVFVKFDSSKDYLFLVPNNVGLSEGEEVICNTRYGKSIGSTVSDSFHLPEDVYKRFISGMKLRESDMKSVNGIVKDVYLFE